MFLKVYKLKFLLAMMLMPFLAMAQAPAGWDFIPTPLTHEIIVPDGIMLEYEGVTVVDGDYIGVFFLDGGALVCGGYVELGAGSNNNFNAYGEFPGLPGFSLGEAFNWKFYDVSESTEYNVQAEYVGVGNVFDGGSSVLNGFVQAFAIAASVSPSTLPIDGGTVDLSAENLDPTNYTVDTDGWEWFAGVTPIGNTKDILGYAVTATTVFTVNAEATSGDMATASVTVVVSGISAGVDDTICANGTFAVAATASPDYVQFTWTKSGSGTFSNPAILNPVYTPSAADLVAGSVILTLNAVSLQSGPATVQMELTFQAEPTIDILPEQDYVCIPDSFYFADVVGANYQQLQWFTTNGGGFFDNEYILNPIYYPSPQIDWVQKCVYIAVSAAPIQPCMVSVADSMNLCFVDKPTVDAGADAGYCTEQAVTHTFAGAATFDPNWPDNTTLLWETSNGDGTFDNASLENATYTFGTNDLANGGVINFTLTAETLEACGPVSDDLSITLQATPTIDILEDTYTICQGDSLNFALQVTADDYSQVQWFTTNGGGFFSNEFIEEPIYYPAPDIDYPQNCIILRVAASPILPCTVSTEDSTLLCFQMLPVVVAGPDATICANETYTTMPTVENSAGPYMWTEDGFGYFEDPTLLNAKYIAHADDANSIVTLTLSAEPIGPCTDAVSGSMELTVLCAPDVWAGDDFTVCETENPELVGVAECVTGTMWATTGDGHFCCPQDLISSYYPGPNDLTVGCVTLVLIGYPLAPCSLYELDKVVVCFDPVPEVEISADAATVCQDQTLQLDADTANVCGLIWTTFDGTGTFDNPNIPNAIYTPSAQDAISGTITLTLTASACGECDVPAVDNIVVTIQNNPVADAGSDMTTCEDTPHYFGVATATNASAVLWSGGQGSFDNDMMLDATYTPAAAEIGDSIELCLTAMPIDPCTMSHTDCMFLYIQGNPAIDILEDSYTICEGDIMDFANEVVGENFSQVQWFTTNGGGFFSNEFVVEPTYSPSPSIDFPQGCIIIKVAASPILPCTISDEDSTLLCFQKNVIVDAGLNDTTCEETPITLTGTATEYSSVLWSDGAGTFDPADALVTEYTPGVGETGVVVLRLTAEAKSPCTVAAIDSMELFVQPAPIADAGADQTVCEMICLPPVPDANGIVNLAGAVQFASGQMWSSTGDGTFDDDGALGAVYTIGDGDIANLNVDLYLTAYAIDPCLTADVDTMTVTVQPSPEAMAGDDKSICEGETVTMEGSTLNAMGVFWDFAIYGEGDGTWDNQLIPDATYDPGDDDVDRGYVELIMVAFPISPCTYPDADRMTVYIIQEPEALAGLDDTICAGESYFLDGWVANATGGVEWTTSGDGTFIPTNDILNPEYAPGPGDIAADSVELCLYAFDGSACNNDYFDCMTLTILPPPEVNAGADQVICEGADVILDGTSDNTSAVLWTSNGDGVFAPDPANVLDPVYTPGVTDIANGTVELTLTGQPLDPCSIPVSDPMTVTINPQPAVLFCFDGVTAVTDSVFYRCFDETVNVSLCEVIQGTGPFTICYTLNNEPDSCVTGVNLGDVFASQILPVGTNDIAITSITDVNGCAALDVTPYQAQVVVHPEPVALFCFNDEPAAQGTVFPYCEDVAVNVTLCEIVDGLGPFEVCYTINGELPETCITLNEGESLFNSTLLPGSYVVQVTSITDTNGCSASDASIAMYTATVNIQANPIIEAGDPQVLCDVDLPVQLAATGANYSSLLWTGGSGSFSIDTILTPTYDPDLAEYGDTITLCIEAQPISPCTLVVFDCVDIFVQPSATAYAGADSTICEGLDFSLADAAATNYSMLTWTHDGDGAFDFTNTLNPVYTPGAGDLNETVELCLTAAAIDPCTMAATDCLDLFIQANPTIDAGPDQDVCDTQLLVQLEATGDDFDSVEWSGGLGDFSNANILDPTYDPNDLENGTSVRLFITAQPIGPCVLVVMDSMDVFIQQSPTAYAGPDTILCVGTPYYIVDATAANYDVVMWTTFNGTGAFDNENIVNPVYTPGMLDVNQTVELCIMAAPITPCTVMAQDCMELFIQANPSIDAGIDQVVCGGTALMAASGSDYSSVLWSGGLGLFSAYDVLDPTYTPAASEFGTTVDLVITAQPISPCQLVVADSMELYIQKDPTVDAGANQVVCEDDFVALNAMADDYSSVMWSGGLGDFSATNILDPSYTPDALEAGNVVTLFIEAMPILPCAVSAIDSLEITIIALPTVNAGMDIEACDNVQSVAVCGTATSYASVLWTTNGDGFFDDAGILCTDYSRGTNDLANGVELFLEVQPLDPPCVVSAIDSLSVTFIPSPLAVAGPPATICQGDLSYALIDANAFNYASLSWTGGDGTFDDPNSLNPIYTPGDGDIAMGYVELCLTAEPNIGCNTASTSCMILTIIPDPVIDPMDDLYLSCDNYDFVNGLWLALDLNPLVGPNPGDYTYQWATDGDGSFDNETAQVTIYTMGTNDKWNGVLNLTLTVVGPAGCGVVVSEILTVYVPQQIIQVDNLDWFDNNYGWRGISSYVGKETTSVPDVMAPAVVEGSVLSPLKFMFDYTGKYYWPSIANPVNQLGDWKPVGYKTKWISEACLPIYGDNAYDTVSSAFPVMSNTGYLFTFLPVLTNEVVLIDTLFADKLGLDSDVLLMYDWMSNLIWTPEDSIGGGLEYLYPGQAYLLVHRPGFDSYTLNFPAVNPANSIVSKVASPAAAIENGNSPWNNVANTAAPHFIFFADEVLSQIQPGDVIGAFNQYNECVGVTEFNQRESLQLLAMGDDPTTEIYEGFEEGEDMSFKLYRPASDQTFDVSFIYDVEYPQYDNLFTVYGVSNVVDVTMSITSVGNDLIGKSLNVFPNPTNSFINIASDYDIKSVTLVNYVGQVVYSSNVNAHDFQINVSEFVTGIYIVRVETAEGNLLTKRITVE